MHFRLGRAYHDSGRFLEAAREFELAYEQSQRPALLYNIFVAYRDAARMPEATRYLRLYLEREPNAENREQLEARLRSMEQAQADEPATPPPTATSDTTSTSTAVATSTTTSSGGGFETWLPGWIIAGVGGAIVIGGVITGVLALDQQAALERDYQCTPDGACALPGFEGARDTGTLLAGLTDGFLFGGAAVLATGVVLALVLGGDSTETSASMACTQEGCAATVGGHF